MQLTYDTMVEFTFEPGGTDLSCSAYEIVYVPKRICLVTSTDSSNLE